MYVFSLSKLLPVHFVHRCTTTHWTCGVSGACLPVWYSARSRFSMAMTTTTRSAWLFFSSIFMAFNVTEAKPLPSEFWCWMKRGWGQFPCWGQYFDAVSWVTGRASILYRIFATYLQRFYSGTSGGNWGVTGQPRFTWKQGHLSPSTNGATKPRPILGGVLF